MEFKKLFVGYFMKSQMKSVDGSSAAPLTNVAAAGLCCPPGCFEQRAQLCVKSADSGPSPSRPGCLWNLELRCNVGESGSCFDEARSGFLSTSTTRTFALLLSLCQLSLSFTALFSPVLHTFTAQYSLCLSILSSFPHLFCFSPCLLFPPPQTAASQLCLVTETAGFACVCAGQQCYALCIFVHTPLFLRICLHTLP